MFLDGGLRLVQLNPVTGALIEETVMNDTTEEGKPLLDLHKGLDMPVALPDILSCDDDFLYMRSQKIRHDGTRVDLTASNQKLTIDVPEQGRHLFSPTGFFDRAWWHRSYWLYGHTWKSGSGGHYEAARIQPWGRVICHDDANIYAFGKTRISNIDGTRYNYRLYAVSKHAPLDPERFSKRMTMAFTPQWTAASPILAQAMVVAGVGSGQPVIVIAGPRQYLDNYNYHGEKTDSVADALARQARALRGQEGGLLVTYDAKTGNLESKQELDSVPVFDGMAAANGCLYLSLADGTVRCFGGETK